MTDHYTWQFSDYLQQSRIKNINVPSLPLGIILWLLYDIHYCLLISEKILVMKVLLSKHRTVDFA